MKKIAFILAAVVAAAALLAGCGKQEGDAPKGMKLASSNSVDYVMYVPEDWRVDQSELYTSAFYSSADATSISASAYGAAVDETVDTWWDGFYKSFCSLYTDCSEPVREDSKLGGVDGARFEFSGVLNGQEYNYIMVACVRGGYVYYITYTSTPDFYESHLDTLGEVIDNFSFR